MALSFSGSGQYLTQPTALVTGMPLTLVCWFKPTSTAANGVLMSVSANSTANSYYMLVMIAAGTLRAQQSTAGTAVSAVAGTNMTAGTWYHCAAVFTSATSRTVYKNGVAVTNGTSNAGGTVNITTVGTNFQGTATAQNVCNGTVSYPDILNVALTSAEITALYNAGLGTDPRGVRNASIFSFSQFKTGSPYPDEFSGSNWTIVGSPTVVADPFSLDAVLVGTSTAQATNSGLLKIPMQVAGVCQSVATNAGNLTVGVATITLVGTSTGHSVNTGTLVTTKLLAGTCSSHTSNVGALTVSDRLAGTCAAKATVSGNLIAKRALIGTSAARSTNSGILVVSKLLAGAGAGHSLSVGTLNVGNVKNLSCTSSGRSTNTGALASGRLLSATCLAHGTCTGNLVSRRVLAGIAQGRSANTGNLISRRALIGTAGSHSNSSGQLQSARRFFGTCLSRAVCFGTLHSNQHDGPCPGMRISARVQTYKKSTVRVINPKTGTVTLVK